MLQTHYDIKRKKEKKNNIQQAGAIETKISFVLVDKKTNKKSRKHQKDVKIYLKELSLQRMLLATDPEKANQVYKKSYESLKESKRKFRFEKQVTGCIVRDA